MDTAPGDIDPAEYGCVGGPVDRGVRTALLEDYRRNALVKGKGFTKAVAALGLVGVRLVKAARSQSRKGAIRVSSVISCKGLIDLYNCPGRVPVYRHPGLGGMDQTYLTSISRYVSQCRASEFRRGGGLHVVLYP